MEMEFSRLERVVGTFIIGVSMLLMATLVIIGRGKDWFETYITYYTTFNESYNLQENAAVKLFKTDIGKIKKIVLEKNRVRVKLAILQKYSSRIRNDAIAVVESPTLIGSEYISIIPGKSESPLIPEQGEIPSREKRSLTDILTEFEVEKTAKMIIKTIQDISDVAQDLSDPNGPLRATLANIEKVSSQVEQMTADLQAGKGPLGTLLRSETVLAQITHNLERMGTILDNINAAAAKAPQTITLVQENLSTYRDTGQAINARVDQARKILGDIQSAAKDLNVVLKNVKTGSYDIPRITTTFRDGIEEIREGVEQIDRVVESLQENYFIRSNLPLEAPAQPTDAGARP